MTLGRKNVIEIKEDVQKSELDSNAKDLLDKKLERLRTLIVIQAFVILIVIWLNLFGKSILEKAIT